jgi:hypothetical protein
VEYKQVGTCYHPRKISRPLHSVANLQIFSEY